MKYILLAFLSMTLTIASYAQSSLTRGLDIGDQAPDFIFINHKNFESKNPKLSDFKGKLVILDFWGTSCAPCIKSFPKMDSLQRKYQDKLLVILVNPRENDTQIEMKLKNVKSPEILQALKRMPKINGDMRWKDYFLYTSIPHHVWIDQNGKIAAITNGTNTNDKSIDAFFRGQMNNMQLKDDYFNTTLKEGLLIKNEHINPAFYSAFFAFIPNFYKPQALVDSKRQTYFRTFAKQELTQFISNLLREKEVSDDRSGHDLRYYNTLERFIIDPVTRSQLQSPKNTDLIQEWKEKYLFNYEIQVPLRDRKELFDIAFHELRYYARNNLNIELKREWKKRRCYVVKILDNELIKTKGGKSADKKSDSLIKCINMTYSAFQYALFAQLEEKSGIPVVFESNGLTTNIDIQLEGDLKHYKVLKKELKRYDIELSKSRRPIEYLRFTSLE